MKIFSGIYLSARLYFYFRGMRAETSAEKSRNSQFLIELDETKKMHPLRGMLAIEYAQIYGAKALTFSPGINLSKSGLSRYFSWQQALYFNVLRPVRWVYRGFGASTHLVVRATRTERQIARDWSNRTFKALNKKSDVLKIRFRGIEVGDLVYDQYLVTDSAVTIDIHSANLHKILYRIAENVLFWQRYFDKHNVSGVCVSHAVYGFAVPLRVALDRGIDGYKTFRNRVVRLNKRARSEGLSETTRLRDALDLWPAEFVRQALEEAKRDLEHRLYSDPRHGLEYMSNLKVEAIPSRPNKRNGNRPFLGIFCHIFDDAPHIYGPGLFEDFWEWLLFLVAQSQLRPDTDFIIKPHPLTSGEQLKYLDELVGAYPNLELVHALTPLFELVNGGLRAGFTVHGTVAHELAYLGVPAVNGSTYHPHRDFSFSVTPDSRRELATCIVDWERLPKPGKQSEVITFCAARYRHNSQLVHVCDGFREGTRSSNTLTRKGAEPYRSLLQSRHGICDRFRQSLRTYLVSDRLVFDGAGPEVL